MFFTSIGFVIGFAECKQLKTITVSGDNKAYSSDTTGALLNKGQTILYQYPIGNERESYSIPTTITTLKSKSFEYSHNLKTITIPSTVTEIEEYAFKEIELLEKFEMEGEGKCTTSS